MGLLADIDMEKVVNTVVFIIVVVGFVVAIFVDPNSE